MSAFSFPILARLRRAGRALLTGEPAQTPASILDFQTGGFGAHRRMQPREVRWIIEQANAGSLDAQWELFAMMEDSWPRLAKNLAELRNAAARATYAVQPYAGRGEKPTASAEDRAALVERAMRQWWPEPGTLELSFEDALFHALDAYGKGVSVLEIHWRQTPDGWLPRAAHVLAPRLYGYDGHGTRLGLRTADRRGWEPFTPDHFLVGIWQARTGAPGATAVLRALAPYWCGITFGWEWLMQNAQIFGVPFRWANYDKSDPSLAVKVRDMLASMAACGYGAFPDGTKLEFKEAATNVKGNPQVVIQEFANKECDLLILGQELSGGAQAAGLGGGAAGLQGSVRADRLKVITQWCANLLSYQLVPAVLRANYGDTEEPPFITADTDDKPDPKALAERDHILLNAHVPMPRAWFYERHGIPPPLKGEEVIGDQPDQPDPSDPSDQPDQPDPDPDPEKKPPVAAKDAHAAAATALFDARAITLLSQAERAALAPLTDALAWVQVAPEDAVPAALKKFQAALDEHGPRLLSNPALAAAWEKVLAPAAAQGAAASRQFKMKV
jgi:phage gp29-like protein